MLRLAQPVQTVCLVPVVLVRPVVVVVQTCVGGPGALHRWVHLIELLGFGFGLRLIVQLQVCVFHRE